jgi:hypothetical protein
MANLSHITRCGLPGIEWAFFARCNGRRIVTLCGRALAQCNNQQMSEVMYAHHCVLGRLDGVWAPIGKCLRSPSFLGPLGAAGDLIEI